MFFCDASIMFVDVKIYPRLTVVALSGVKYVGHLG